MTIPVTVLLSLAAVIHISVTFAENPKLTSWPLGRWTNGAGPTAAAR